MAHRNARTTLYARHLVVTLYHAGWPPAHIAEQLGISRATVYKWINRYDTEGDVGLVDRSSRPHTSPARLSRVTEQRVLAARARRGAVYLAGQLGLVASTVGRVLRRHNVPHLAVLDPMTGTPVRRRWASPGLHRRPRHRRSMSHHSLTIDRAASVRRNLVKQFRGQRLITNDAIETVPWHVFFQPAPGHPRPAPVPTVD